MTKQMDTLYLQKQFILVFLTLSMFLIHLSSFFDSVLIKFVFLFDFFFYCWYNI